MFELFNDVDKNKFSWDSIGDIKNGRLNLGENMPVFVFRLFQFSIRKELENQIGKEKTKQIFKNAGEVAGVEFAHKMLDLTLPINDLIASLKVVLLESKIGVLRIEEYNEAYGKIILTISEDLDCSGLTHTGETVCDYDEGFLAGILFAYTNKNYDVIETDCWATGAKTCRFEANLIKGD